MPVKRRGTVNFESLVPRRRREDPLARKALVDPYSLAIRDCAQSSDQHHFAGALLASRRWDDVAVGSVHGNQAHTRSQAGEHLGKIRGRVAVVTSAVEGNQTPGATGLKRRF